VVGETGEAEVGLAGAILLYSSFPSPKMMSEDGDRGKYLGRRPVASPLQIRMNDYRHDNLLSLHELPV
jgi:hypothetical protein